MEFLAVPLFDDDIYKLIVRLVFNLVFLGLVVFVAYYPKNHNQNYVFTFFLMNVMVFFICFTLKKMELELGMALGLFAIFSIIRYRTDQIKVKEMTYLFIVIGIAVINSLANRKTSYTELIFANSVIFAITLGFENHFLKLKTTRSQNIVFDKIELLAPSRRDDLIRDIQERTGLTPCRIKVQKIDLSTGKGNIVVYYETDDDQE